MSELRRDPITGRWIIVNTDNPKKAEEYGGGAHVRKGPEGCPFCAGNEKLTPPEVVAYGRPQPNPDTPGWRLRVVPNKYPALQVGTDLGRVGAGMHDQMNGIGIHEVIIETPNHDSEIPNRSQCELEEMLWCYRDRSLELRKISYLKYILLFKNYGFQAGASLEHSHSQLIGLPFLPKRVVGELRGSTQYFEYKERCVYCDIIAQEAAEHTTSIVENSHFLAFCPFVSCFPFEIWIIPKQHICDFSYIQKDEIVDLAGIMKIIFSKLRKALKDPAYNYMIHTCPLDGHPREDYHWHIEIVPIVTRVAGFEWGTGFYINPTPPELAAETLRKIEI